MRVQIMKIKLKYTFLIIIFIFINSVICIRHQYYTKEKIREKREEVREMFQHAYNGYLTYANGYDELRPITCDGVNTWGSYSLTLIDALDTLAVMGNYSEFRRVVKYLVENSNFDSDINVSVFETNIRIVGGLLSAHLMSRRAGLEVEHGWPCNGPLLRMAEDVARRLLLAFDTKTGMPYGTVNLRYGVPPGETTVTCIAGVGTFLIEFGALSRLSGDPIYEEVALNAVYSLWKYRSALGLFGNHIDIQTGRWTAQDSGIGAGVDSYFEYLLKGAILLNRPDLLEMFHESRRAIDKYLKKEDWYVWVSMMKGHVTLPVFQSLEAFWPGLLTLIGDIEPARKTFAKYHSVWSQYGFLPEFYNIPNGEATANRESYPLRPELIESAMLLYRATKDHYYLEVGDDMLRSIQHSSRTNCGYSTIKNVRTHERDNRMESFFLAETTKYLYLLFDPDNFLHNDGGNGLLLDTPNGECIVEAGNYIFNTEAHPIDPASLHCCYAAGKIDIFEDFDIKDYRDAEIDTAKRKRLKTELDEKSEKYNCPKIQPRDANITIDLEFEIDIVGANLTASEKFASQIQVEQSGAEENFSNFGNFDITIEEPRRPRIEIDIGDEIWRVLEVALNKRLEEQQLGEIVKTEEIAGLLILLMKGIDIKKSLMPHSTQIHNLNEIPPLNHIPKGKTLYDLFMNRQRKIMSSKAINDIDNFYKEQNQNGQSVDLNWLLQLVTDIIVIHKNYYEGEPTNDPTTLAVLKLLLNVQRHFEHNMQNATGIYEFIIEFIGDENSNKQLSSDMLKKFRLIEKPILTEPFNTEIERIKYGVFEHFLEILEFKQRISETLTKLDHMTKTFDIVVPDDSNNLNRNDDIILLNRDHDDNFDETETGIGSVEPVDDKDLNNDDLINTNSEPIAPPKKLKSYLDEDAIAENPSILSNFVQSILKSTVKTKPIFEPQLLLEKIRNKTNSEYMNYTENWEVFQCKAPSFLEKIHVQGIL